MMNWLQVIHSLEAHTIQPSMNDKMDYGLPGSPEGHIDGVNLKMDKHSQKLNHHRDISFLNFQTFDLDQRLLTIIILNSLRVQALLLFLWVKTFSLYKVS